MAEEPNTRPAPGTPPAGTAQPQTPVAAAPTLLGADTPKVETPTAPTMPEGFEGGADAWTKLDDAGRTAVTTAATEKAATESTARADAFAKAEGKDAKMAAYQALTPEEKAKTFKDMPEAQRKELGVEDPEIPVYTDFKMPEGVTVDTEAMGKVTDLFKEARIPQETAQKFIDMAIAREQAAAQQGVQAFVDLQTKWVGEIKADPEIGGDKLTASMASAARAIDRLGVPGLKEALNLTGAGNNPAIVKAFVRLGQMVSEDRFVPGRDAPPEAPKSPAQTIYGDGGPKQDAG